MKVTRDKKTLESKHISTNNNNELWTFFLRLIVGSLNCLFSFVCFLLLLLENKKNKNDKCIFKCLILV